MDLQAESPDKDSEDDAFKCGPEGGEEGEGWGSDSQPEACTPTPPSAGKRKKKRKKRYLKLKYVTVWMYWCFDASSSPECWQKLLGKDDYNLAARHVCPPLSVSSLPDDCGSISSTANMKVVSYPAYTNV